MSEDDKQSVSEVPQDGTDRRNWIRYQLSLRKRADGSRYNQEAVAGEAYASSGTVSVVYLGAQTGGRKVEKIMRITARILGMSTDELFGVWLEPGDGYVGSDPAKRPADKEVR